MQTNPRNLYAPVIPSVNDELARIMSALTKDGRVPTFDEVLAEQARRYASEQGPCETVDYDERRGA